MTGRNRFFSVDSTLRYGVRKTPRPQGEVEGELSWGSETFKIKIVFVIPVENHPPALPPHRERRSLIRGNIYVLTIYMCI